MTERPATGFSLAEGLVLEDVGVTLPWGTTWRHLARLGAPNVVVRRPLRHLDWGERTILGGYRHRVATFLHADDRQVRFEFTFGTLHQPWYYAEAIEVLDVERAQLEQYLGTSTSRTTDVVLWALDGATVRLAINEGSEFASYNYRVSLMIRGPSPQLSA